MKRTKTKFLHSLIALFACFAMLIGSTFAWFTDNVSSMNNIITSGNLDLKMYWTDDLNSGVWYDVEDDANNTIFGYDNWEPGYTQVRYLKLVNAGSLALDYRLAITPQGAVGKLAEVITVHYADEAVPMNDRADLSNLNSIGLLSYVMSGTVSPEGTLLAAGQSSPLHDSGETVITLAMSMLTTAGNDYQNESVGEGFTVTAVATQAVFETDSFGDDYDENAEYAELLLPSKVTAAVTNNAGVLAATTTMTDGRVSATLPAGVALKDGVSEVTLEVTPKENATSDITVVGNEILIPLDVHIEGVDENNTTPIVIDLGAVMPKGLNIGNYSVIHVEDGSNNAMTYVDDVAALTAHNQFAYDPATGSLTVSMATFSPVEILAVDDEGKWEGGVDYSWYDKDATTLYIANADQLNALSRIVGGMVPAEIGIEQDSFEGKTIELLTNIDLNDVIDGNGKVFYPVGAYNNAGRFPDKTTENATGNIGGANKDEAVASNVYSFRGVFDGQGCTIANFYQNTWEMFGDYNDGYEGTPNYYKDAMGVFGYVVGGTIKNLTVENFSSDGEYTPTGVIAAYASESVFENIAIINCNPRVYNTGNGGIVGIGGDTREGYETEESVLTFKNITVDGTNTISALWGSWGVACGGIVGLFRGPGQVDMTNCHVAAQIDVNNDVCSNYQYYLYRYAGMLIGTNKNMVTREDGRIYPELTKIHTKGCTVNFENWNDYYYCEMVVNTIASYTHDHQFSRLTEVESVDKVAKTYVPLGATESVAVPATGRYNFVVRTDKTVHSTENATCYHFVDGEVWNHEDAGFEDFDLDGNGKLDDYKEDRHHYYLPFNQLITGDGMGISHIPIAADNSNELGDVTVLGSAKANSVPKFDSLLSGANDWTGNAAQYESGKVLKVGELFKAAADANINADSVYVAIIPVYGSVETASGVYAPNAADWTQGEVTLNGEGDVYIVITDYNYCRATTIKVGVGSADNDTDLEW